MILNESILDSNIDVLYKGVQYYTGNRYGTQVELWKDHSFYMNVSMKDISIKNPEVILQALKKKRERLVDELSKIDKNISCFNE